MQPNNWDLERIINEVTNGQLALPEFQRDFVWRAGDSREFLTSVFKNYPTGALLFLENRSRRIFQEKPVEGGPIPKTPPLRLILDGQQRITTVFQALTGVGENI